MIVLFHSRGLFGFGQFTLWTGRAVSFFFVLSGFILAYVYPELKGLEASCRFLLGRFARLWPAHVVAFILVLLFLPSSQWRHPGWPWAMVANLSMIHAWIPLPSFFFSYNWSSWFISAEFFLYLCFPLLIYRWNRTWLAKLLLTFALVIIIVSISNVLHLPPYVGGQNNVSISGVLNFNPLSCLPEFVFGMSLALIWTKMSHIRYRGMLFGTLIEIAAIGLVVCSMHFTPQLAELARKGLLGGSDAGYVWINKVCSAPFFGILILVMALEKGLISRLLSFPFAVLLGELSYSIYLLHQVLLRYYQVHLSVFSEVPGYLAYTIFWVILLLLAHLMFNCVEKPCRQFIIRLWPMKPINDSDSPPLEQFEQPLI